MTKLERLLEQTDAAIGKRVRELDALRIAADALQRLNAKDEWSSEDETAFRRIADWTEQTLSQLR